MNFQISRSRKLLRAQFAGIRLFACVCPKMNFQISRSRKLLRAQFAGERFLACVYSSVNSKETTLCKFFRTKFASVQLVSCMNSNVSLHSRLAANDYNKPHLLGRIGKVHKTYRTYVNFFDTVFDLTRRGCDVNLTGRAEQRPAFCPADT